MDNTISVNMDELQKIANTDYEGKVVFNSHKLDRLPFFDVEIYFSQDLWDFKDYIPEMGSDKNRYDFSKIHYAYKDYVKRYVLELILNKNASSTINKYFGYMCKTVDFFIDNYVYDCTQITRDIINKYNDYLSGRLESENERIHNRRICIKLLKYIERHMNVDYSYERDILSENDTELLKDQIENGKTPNIPSDVYDNIISLGVKELLSDKSTDTEKFEACMVLMLSQVGMRIHELSLVKAGMKQSKLCFGETKKVNYLEFYTFKSERFKKTGRRTKSFLTEIGELAYDNLEKLSEQRREKLNTEYIFTNDSSTMPLNTQTLSNMLYRFVVRNSVELGLINKSYDGFYIFNLEQNRRSRKVKAEYCSHLSETDTVAIPTSRQFRVAVCNELIRTGKELSWIVEHMNHLYEETTQHYGRYGDDDKKTDDLSKGVLHGIITGEFKLIGEEAEFIINKIDEFLKEKKFNVKSNLDEIINELVQKVPIREKKGGFCIKSAYGKKCKYNEYFCAFELCPNHCTAYFLVDITYSRFKSSLQAIEYNNSNNFLAEANVEIKKLQRLVKRDLIPELDELKEEIRKHSKDVIINKQKKLEYIVNNLSEIILEVKPWLID